MQIKYKGLMRERLPSGNIRYRVRVKGDKTRKISIPVPPEHPDFIRHYNAARMGTVLETFDKAAQTSVEQSVAWLCYLYLSDFEKRVQAGLNSDKTLKKKRLLLNILIERYAHMHCLIPTRELIALRDDFQDRPAYADDLISAVSVMYDWAILQEICFDNPAKNVPKIYKGGQGAVPWSLDDLNKFKQRHPFGSPAHLALTLFVFTACRIGDAIHLGKGNEGIEGGIRTLAWQPAKRGSTFVKIPMLPPLVKATQAANDGRPAYLIKPDGSVYSSESALGHRMKKWCTQAGLKNRSSHGIRKAAGNLLAQQGCTQYEIMAVHGHNESKTSEIYTRGVNRFQLAQSAMDRLKDFDF